MVEKIDDILFEIEQSEELKKDEGFLVPTKNIWVVDALRDYNKILEQERDEEKKRADEEKKRADEEKKRADELERKLMEILKK